MRTQIASITMCASAARSVFDTAWADMVGGVREGGVPVWLFVTPQQQPTCQSTFNGDISKWEVGHVTNMKVRLRAASHLCRR